MNEPKKLAPAHCPNCGQPLTANAPDGLCLTCLMKLGTAATFLVAEDVGLESSATPPPAHQHFGDYELVERLSPGGMGVVYRARQVSVDRQVAVKMILEGAFSSEDSLRRFRAEASIMAGLRHPNIVTLYEVGEQGGQPYFSMEYVAGSTLDRLSPATTPAREAARLVAIVARALHYVHERGVVHRDLKPANILLDEMGQPRVTDFGMARRLEGPGNFTLTGQVLGTLEYMSPEQLAPKLGPVTARSDVYSLGAVFYFLLTGRAPFVVADILTAVREDEPVAPSRFQPGLPPELDTICLTCLATAPSRRYPSAAALAEDLERWLAGKAITAQPVGSGRRVWMWAKRHPLVSVLSAILLLSILGGATAFFLEWRRAEASAREMRNTNLAIKGRQIEALFAEHKSQEAVATLANSVRLDPQSYVASARLVSALTHNNFTLPSGPAMADGSKILIAKFLGDGSRIVTAELGANLRLWDARTCLPLTQPVIHPARIDGIGASTDGQIIAAFILNDGIYLWDGQTGAARGKLNCPTAVASDLSRDGTRIAVACSNGEVAVYHVNPPALAYRWPAASGALASVEFSEDGKFIATGSQAGVIRVWDAQPPPRLVTEILEATNAGAAHFNPGASRLLVPASTNQIQLCEFPSGRLITNIECNHMFSDICAFSPDGTRFAQATGPGPVCVFDMTTGRQVLRYEGHSNEVFAIDFSPDGKWIASGGIDSTAQVWDAATGQAVCEPIRLAHSASSVHFDQSGQKLLTVTFGQCAQVWEVADKRARPLKITENQPIRGFELSEDGRQFYTVSADGAVRVRDGRSGKRIKTISPGGNKVDWAAFDLRNHHALLDETNAGASLVDLATGATCRLDPGETNNLGKLFDFSQDGRLVALATVNSVFVFDSKTGKRRLPPLTADLVRRNLGDLIYSIRFSPDGTRLVAGCNAFHARLWDTSTGAVLANLTHEGPVMSAEFSPDGKNIITAGLDNTARIWAVTNLAAPVKILRHQAYVSRAIYSADGSHILTGTIANDAFVWDAASGLQTSLPMHHDGFAVPMAFSATGQKVLTRGNFKDYGQFREWDADSGLPLGEFITSYSTDISLTAAWDAFATLDARGNALIWNDKSLPAPSPEWLPALAEAVAGMRYRANDTEEAVPTAEFLELKKRLLSSPANDPWTRWAKWFLSDPASRTRSFDTDLTEKDLSN